jgi:uncharacterized protein
MTNILESGPENASHRLIIAHGAGAGITNPFLEAFTLLISARGIAVTRFEFEKLMPEYAKIVEAIAAKRTKGQKLVIGGKSLGGRVASMIADTCFSEGSITGLVCLGYPFHPPKQPQTWRTQHLIPMQCPTLIVQGERDPFGTRAEIEALALSPAIAFHWIGDGDHDFGPRGASGFTRKGNLANAADAVAAFILDMR